LKCLANTNARGSNLLIFALFNVLFYLYQIAKLANDPLLRTSISLVAAGKGAAETKEEEEEVGGQGSKSGSDATSAEAAKASAQETLDKAVSTALLLACTVGLIQASVYALGSPFLMAGMGLTPNSPM
jgi:Flp pilus assembly protein TadB